MQCRQWLLLLLLLVARGQSQLGIVLPIVLQWLVLLLLGVLRLEELLLVVWRAR